MPTSLLTTKFFIPSTRPELVLRPRLIEQLNGGLHRKMTLISAPAGFGKTTLVCEWVDNIRLDAKKEHQRVFRIAWISLDESDNDAIRFLNYLLTALSRTAGNEPALGGAALSMLQSPQPPPTEAILTSIINEIADIPDGIILVLDDYHLIETSPLHDALSFFLEHLPPKMHLVIVTREDPHLPFARLRAKDQLTELRAADLRFTSSEAAEFLNRVMGFNLSIEDVSALETRTEGWVAGLQLAAISMRGHPDVTNLIKSFTGSHRLVLDYLIEEVLEQQSESVQSFLLKTAILNRMTGSLCDALTGQENGQETLEMLELTNLFIVPLDEERRWYRYHHLFADLLHHRLKQLSSELPSKLHRKASRWFEKNGFEDEAIAHALKASDFDHAAEMIEKHIDDIWGTGQHAVIHRWLNGLPVELILSKPQLCIPHAWDMVTLGKQDAAEQSLRAIEKAFDPSDLHPSEILLPKSGQPPDSEKMMLFGRIATIRAFMSFNRSDFQELSKFALRALEFLPDHDLAWRSAATVALGDAYILMGDMNNAHRARIDALEASKTAGNFYMIIIAGMKLAITLRQQGQLDLVIEICNEMLKLASENGLSQIVVVGWLLAVWGEVLAELNELDEAIDRAKKGVEIAERGNDLAIIGWSNLCLMRVLYSNGDVSGTEEIIRKMEDIGRKYTVSPWIMSHMAAWQARLSLDHGDVKSAAKWVKEQALHPDGELSYQREFDYITLARVLIVQGEIAEVIELLKRMFKASESGGRISKTIEILILQALAYQAKGDTSRAATALEKALTLAAPEGYIRTFVDEGPPIEALLKRVKVEDRETKDYIGRLLAAFSYTMVRPSSSNPQPLIEPLSERELEVLYHLAEGLTNQEIASRLFLSPNTVKAHTHNIYGKLGANNRTQAATKARELKLIPFT
jgi:LuxR family maltose regulon positive regulatory protein